MKNDEPRPTAPETGRTFQASRWTWAMSTFCLVGLGAILVLRAAENEAATKSAPLPAQVIYSSPHSYSKPAKETTQVRIGQSVPDFTMTDLSGKPHLLSEWKGKLTVLFFADLTCPCVQAYNSRMQELHKKYEARGLHIAYIYSAPEDKVQAIREAVEMVGYPWTIVRDADQKLMNLFNAQCTTESFLIDGEGRLRYHGRFDDSTFSTDQVKNRDLEDAVVALLEGKEVARPETKAYACTIRRLTPPQHTPKAGANGDTKPKTTQNTKKG